MANTAEGFAGTCDVTVGAVAVVVRTTQKKVDVDLVTEAQCLRQLGCYNKAP